MRWVALLVVVIGVVGWPVANKLSSDAIGMAIGLALGVLASVPAAALVLVASRPGRRDSVVLIVPASPSPALLRGGGLLPDEWPTMRAVDAPSASAYAEEVTPYTHLARRILNMPALPARREEIARMRAVLDEMEREEVWR